MGGSRFRGFTKVDLLIVVVLLLVLGLPFYDAACDSPYKTRLWTCRNNLHQIGLAVLSYRAAHQDQMPPGLKSLLPLLGNQSVLLCPLSGFTPAPPYERSYTYRFVRQPRGGDIICWDSGPHRPDHSVFVWLNRESRNVLYADGRVGTVSEGKFDHLGLQGVTLALWPQ